MASFGGVTAAGFTVQGMNVVLSMLIPIGLSFLFGLGNGYLITRFRIFSFIATLSRTILGGVTFWYTGGATILVVFPILFCGSVKRKSALFNSTILMIAVVVFWFILAGQFGRQYMRWGTQCIPVSGVHVSHPGKTYALGYLHFYQLLPELF